MKTSLLILVFTLTNYITCNGINNDPHPLSDEFINSINEEQTLWRAGRNFRPDIPMSYIKNLMGYRPHPRTDIPKIRHEVVDSDIPESLDLRDLYPNCTTLKDIRDQGSCGSCWAFGAAEAMSDRICIHSQGKENVYISADDIVSCCEDCGDGCFGGNPLLAFDYWKTTGIVTGGPYKSSQGCRPYEIPPCEHHINGTLPSCDKHHYDTPSCKKSCRDGYTLTYEQDLHFGKGAYGVDNDVKQIQTEIMKNGPVTAGFAVHDDFAHYKKGVYKNTKGNVLGYHAVKILGWGVENNTPYWLVANSWNAEWGDKGYFKILRGENHCQIEELISAGMPA